MSLPLTHAPHLFKPLPRLGGIGQLSNRMVLAPLTRGRSGADRVPKDRNVKYYADRATYAGLLIAEGTHPFESGIGWVDSPGIYNEQQVEGWKQVVDAVHAKGSKIVLQLWHMGRAAHSSFLDGKLPIAPSAIAIEGDTHHPNGSKVPYEVPRALETAEIPGVAEQFRKSAQLAKKAGFDGLELHCANGYLLNTFLESSTNTRTDQYGGSLENRCRFMVEVLDVLSSEWPSNRIGVRFSPNGAYNSMGAPDNIETYSYALQLLAKRDLAYVHVMDGLAFGFHGKCEQFTLERVRKLYPGCIIGNCGYDRDTGDAAIASGNADAIAYGRPWIENPDLPYRYAHGLELTPPNPAFWFTHDDEGYADHAFAPPVEVKA